MKEMDGDAFYFEGMGGVVISLSLGIVQKSTNKISCVCVHALCANLIVLETKRRYKSLIRP